MSFPDDRQASRSRAAIERLNADFAYFLDHDQVEELACLFTEDALYTHGKRESRGRAAIRALFAGRLAAGTRTTRHVYSGLRIELDGPDVASGSSVCMTFAHDGPVPVPHALVHLVADFIDRYALCPDGQWRIARRDIRRIFVAPGNEGPVGLDSSRGTAGG